MPSVRLVHRRSVVAEAKFGVRAAQAEQHVRRRHKLDEGERVVQRVDFVLGSRRAKPKSEIGILFERYAAEVERKARFASSLEAVAYTDAYQQIVGMGSIALPYVMRSLCEGRSVTWLRALAAITRQDAAAGAETVEEAVIAWLAWGSRHGYIDSASA